MAPTSVAETNYIRLALLLSGIIPRVVRTLFDKEFPPTNLPSTLNINAEILKRLKSRKNLNKAQWDLLFPKNNVVPNSMNFDVTLMICLIRHLTAIHYPINGFDTLPAHVETAPGSDLARIKWFRNKLYHCESKTVDNAFFTEAWGCLSDAVGRLGDQIMIQECHELKSKILDLSNQELMREIRQSQEEIKEMKLSSQEEIKEMKLSINNLESDHEELKEDVEKLKISTNNSKTNETGESVAMVQMLNGSCPEEGNPGMSTPRQNGTSKTLESDLTDRLECITDVKSKKKKRKGSTRRAKSKSSAANLRTHQTSTSYAETRVDRTLTQNVAGAAIENSRCLSGVLNPVFDLERGDSENSANFMELSIEDHEPPMQCIGNKSKRTITFIAVCLGIVGALTFTLYYKHILGGFDNFNDPENTNVLLTQDPCGKDVSITLIGQRICIPYTQKFTGSGSDPSFIYVKQLSSKFLRALKVFSFHVLSATFVQKIGEWIVSFNSSRHDQQFRFVQEKATCDNVGKYEITIGYSGGTVTSFVIEIALEEPRLIQSIFRINDSIHIHCEMTNNCKTVSLGLIVNDGESSRLIPDTNECRNNEKKNSSTITADAIVPVSWFSGNQTISCIPLMTDPELAANLTSTMGIPVCEGYDCEPNCKDNPQGIAYYGDKNFCNVFYHCSNGDTILQNCSNGTSWSHNECTCGHFNDTICDETTHRFFKPAISFEKCTKI